MNDIYRLERKYYTDIYQGVTLKVGYLTMIFIDPVSTYYICRARRKLLKIS